MEGGEAPHVLGRHLVQLFSYSDAGTFPLVFRKWEVQQQSYSYNTWSYTLHNWEPGRHSISNQQETRTRWKTDSDWSEDPHPHFFDADPQHCFRGLTLSFDVDLGVYRYIKKYTPNPSQPRGGISVVVIWGKKYEKGKEKREEIGI